MPCQDFSLSGLRLCLRLAGLGLVASAFGNTAWAQDGDGEPKFKLTVAGHGFSENGQGLDVNLRHSSQMGNTWLGYFNANGLNADQFRAGWDSAWGDALRVLPSLQMASGGFVGGSLGLETGSTWVVGAGLGRTNQRPYFNLNFDPNDALSLSLAYRAEHSVSYALSVTRDNRDNPDQQHVHLVYRAPVNDGDRLTLDLLYKSGLVNGDSIGKFGATITYDWPRYFVRLAYDPNTNFTVDNAVRISIGTRF